MSQFLRQCVLSNALPAEASPSLHSNALSDRVLNLFAKHLKKGRSAGFSETKSLPDGCTCAFVKYVLTKFEKCHSLVE